MLRVLVQNADESWRAPARLCPSIGGRALLAGFAPATPVQTADATVVFAACNLIELMPGLDIQDFARSIHLTEGRL
ncbi:MAG: hypothetical protein IT285_03755 [Bdellovibrionales bacterium]|nr:hypothetical protein [Bdellovibrionales bacterium]